MNATIKTLITDKLKELLALCTAEQQLLFKKLYGHKKLNANIDTIVDEMDETKMDYAMTQIERTLNSKN